MPEVHPQSSPRTESASAAEAIQSKAADVAEQAQEKAQQATDRLQDRVREQIEQRSSQAAKQIKEQGSDLRSVGESLRREGKDGPAKAADRLAEYANRVGEYLSEKDSTALLSDAEDLGRRRPWAVAAGGLALGFAASRFLKASSSERYQARPASPRATPSASVDGVADSGRAAIPSSVAPGAAPGVL